MLKKTNTSSDKRSINGTSLKNVPESFRISESLNKNTGFFRSLSSDDKTLKIRTLSSPVNPSLHIGLVFIDGLVDDIIINQDIIAPILTSRIKSAENISPFDLLFKHILFGGDIFKTDSTDILFNNLLTGNTVIFVEGSSSCIIASTKKYSLRSISEPEDEKVTNGPHEGFGESIIQNLSLLRRKITDPDLRLEFYSLGRKTSTTVCICYMDGLADSKTLNSVRKRISEIDIDCILDTEYIQEIIKDGRYSLFRTTGSTQRPDVAAAKLLEGRIAILVNGSPVAATLPFVFLEYFHIADDYYSDPFYASFNRLLRISGFFMTISLPAIYLALVTFHREMLPLKFLMTAAESRNGMPLSSFMEILILILIFELIREGSSRIPSNVGAAFSIVGGVVLGQASVEARFVSLPIVIIVALTCLTGMMIPQLRGPSIFLRFMLLLLAKFMGIFGYMAGMIFIIFMICSLESFSIPYSSLTARDTAQTFTDTFMRMPWPLMRKRPYISDTCDITRQR